MNIPEIQLKIKNILADLVGEWGLIGIVFLVGLASFGLGRLSALEEAKPVVSVQEAPQEAKAKGMAPGGLIVASRKGSAYHYPWCAGAQTMAETNKVWFPSEAGAKAAGYSPAKNCKGLGE